MKKIIFLLGFSFCLFGCTATQEKSKESATLSFDKEANGEWEIVVLDPQYTSFLTTQQPKEYFSEQMLKTKNIFYVAEWNSRNAQPFAYDPSVYEMKIEYDPDENYGLEFEYRLYMFFRFVEKKYKVRF
mgnify:CR=1 FL=1